MRVRVRLAAAATVDLEEILARLHVEAGRRVSERYRADFDALVERLAAHPDSGSLRRKWGAGIRIGVMTPYIVVYRHAPGSDEVVVLRMLHGARKITRKLLDP